MTPTNYLFSSSSSSSFSSLGRIPSEIVQQVRAFLGCNMPVLHASDAVCMYGKNMGIFPYSLHSYILRKRQDKHLTRLVSESWILYKTFNNNHLRSSLRQVVPQRSVRKQIHASSDEDCGSSRDIAISLYRQYRNFTDRGGTNNLKEFISAGVNAYAVGCTDEGIRMELLNMKDSGIEIDGLQSYGGRTRLKYKIYSEEVRECVLWLSIIFITILCTPQPTVVRWSSTPPVSEKVMLQWKGFCALIANAYYIKGMAWLPVKTLQLEQRFVMGRAEEPSLVSSRMQLVFSTLEVVSPQWPRV